MDKLKFWLLFVWTIHCVAEVHGQANSGTILFQDTQNKNITTAVPFLMITPDSRSAALGDAGVASSPDANAAYWNAGKLAFIETGYGGSLSYTPWLGKIVNDMRLVNLSGFYRINREQVAGISLRYFDMGRIELNTGPGAQNIIGTYNPREMSVDATYSRLLTDRLSIGGSLRYIYSNLTGALPGNNDGTSAHSVAVDIGVYYTKLLTNKSTLSLGASISNIGAKVNYTNAGNADFIPTNLRLGGGYKITINPLNSFTFLLDLNKLMVPTTVPGSRLKPLLSGIFSSFSDAPGGFSEELSEINIASGVEYWYRSVFAGRIGYFYEDQTKGNRKYLTVGIGFKLDQFNIDAAYMIPTNKRENALAETLRFSIMYQLPTQVSAQKSVTD